MTEPLSMDKARESLGKSLDGLGRFARNSSTHLAVQAGDFKDSAVGTVEKLTAKKPDPYEEAIVEYNGAFTLMNDAGLSLLRQRERAADLIELVESLVNSIACTPKSFERDFIEINADKTSFVDATEFAQRDLAAARQSAAGAGAGFTAGAAVASMAPSAAIWVATTFGTASTGSAISTLSGAAATKAALAWLGGGALAAGGNGIAGGGALLALAGPVGWGIAGATLLASIALLARKKFENREAKQEALTALTRNTALVRGMDAEISDLLERTAALRGLLVTSYGGALGLFGADFRTLEPARQSQLAALVNNTKACAALLSRRVEQDAPGE
ncbi:hypothetical protein ABZ319_13175 [Nocardia sp. NPDC005978]|uniref:hypothetical protein n=1 Tax=Nocardia sp. NPDC005978 TaxID=3156725 RepID=UPI0033ADBE0A